MVVLVNQEKTLVPVMDNDIITYYTFDNNNIFNCL